MVCEPGLSKSVGTIGFSNLDYFEFLKLINILKFRHIHFFLVAHIIDYYVVETDFGKC